MVDNGSWSATAASHYSDADELSLFEIARVQMRRACCFTMESCLPTAFVSSFVRLVVCFAPKAFLSIVGMREGPFCYWWAIRILTDAAVLPYFTKYGLPSLGIPPGLAPQIVQIISHQFVVYAALHNSFRLGVHCCDIRTLLFFVLIVCVARLVGFAMARCYSHLALSCVHEGLDSVEEKGSEEQDPSNRCKLVRGKICQAVACTVVNNALEWSFLMCGFMLQPTLGDLRMTWPRVAMFLSVVVPSLIKCARLCLMEKMRNAWGIPSALEPCCVSQLIVHSGQEYCSKISAYFQDDVLDILAVLLGQTTLELLIRSAKFSFLWRTTQFSYSLLENGEFGECGVETRSDASSAFSRMTLSRDIVAVELDKQISLPRLLGQYHSSNKHEAGHLDAEFVDAMECSEPPGDISTDMLQAMITTSLEEDIKGACEYSAHIGVAIACWTSGTLNNQQFALALSLGVISEALTDVAAAFFERAAGMRGVARYTMPNTLILHAFFLFYTALHTTICIMVQEFKWDLF